MHFFKSFFLSSIVVFSSFCCGAENKVENDHVDFQIVANPVLSGLDRMAIFVEPSDVRLQTNKIFWRRLEGSIKNTLSDAGINIDTPRDKFGNPAVQEVSDMRVSIDSVNFGQREGHAFRITTSVSITIKLGNQHQQFFKDVVWSRGSTFLVTSSKDIGPAISKVVGQQLEAFVRDYKVANGLETSSQKKRCCKRKRESA